MPYHSKGVVEVVDKGSAKPHSSLLFDLTQGNPDALRIRTNIFPDEIMHMYTHEKHANTPIYR